MNIENNDKQQAKAKENVKIIIFNFWRKLILTYNVRCPFRNPYASSNGVGWS